MTEIASTSSAVGKAWRVFVLWSGAAVCLAGLLDYRPWQAWQDVRFFEVLVIGLTALAGAWPLRRLLRLSWADALVAIWGIALVVFAGPSPVAGTLLLALFAVALGSLVSGPSNIALRCVCGLVLFAGVVGWLLPLPIHFRWLYLALCVGVVAWRRRALRLTMQEARNGFASAVSAAPYPAAFAILLLGIATTACWLPTLQFDDLGYHLRLVSQLQYQSHYVLDPTEHVWALAPWAADVLQAIAQLLSGAEARGPVNALWIAITASGLWHLVAALGGTTRASWLSVALYGSVPLTAALAGGMQTEIPTAAVVVWLAVLISRKPDVLRDNLYRGAVLVGGLIALKLSAAAAALILLPWMLWRNGRQQPWPRLPAALAIVLAIGGANYAYAAIVTGNPFLPFFNGVFKSPYFAAHNLDDVLWQAGFDTLLPWNITFDTHRYLETYDGGAGFALVGLAGAWLLAFFDRRTLAAALAASALLLLPLLPIQYLRYVYPGFILLLTVLVVASERADPKRAHWLIVGLCVVNAFFMSKAHWTLADGAVVEAVKALGRDAPLEARFAPERVLIAKIRSTHAQPGVVLATDPDRPFVAEVPGGRTVS